MAHLSILLFGPFQVLCDGRPVTGFESARARALLAVLAVEAERPHAREALAELLWPEHPPAAAAANLRHTLTNLRKTIGDATAEPPYLLVTQETLQFNAVSDASVDVCEFTRSMRTRSLQSPAACQQALALRRGPFMDGFALDGSPPLEEWIVIVREQLDHQIGKVLRHLTHDCIDRMAFDEAAVWTQQHLTLEPWNEDVHHQLIWLLAKVGQRGAALHQYEVCRRVLATELDVEPQQATQALAARIRDGAIDIGELARGERESLPSPATLPAVSRVVRLPPRSPVFFGRAHECAEIARCLADRTCHLLTILGPGGMGKTQIAVEVAHAQVEHFPDGVVFVDLTIVAAPESMAGAILNALGGTQPAIADARRQLFTLLKRRSLLLVLDNFEHLIAGTDLLVDLLSAAPGVKVLVTSRTRLNLREEWLAPLDGLDMPSESDHLINPDDLEKHSATRLFLHGARRVRPGFTPTAQESAVVGSICRLLAGIPLGIELAAAWVRSLALDEIARELTQGPALLATTLHDIPPRHRSMVTIFDASWQILAEAERAVLRRLSVFRGGCTRDAAGKVAGATMDTLTSLIDKSWLRLRPDGRYDLHEMIRQYCNSKLECEHAVVSQEPATAVHQRHRIYYADLLHGVLGTMNYQQVVGDAVLAELGNVEVALAWAVATEDVTAGYALVVGLIFVADLQGWYRFAIRTLDAMLKATESPGATGDGPPISAPVILIRAWIRLWLANFHLVLGLFEHAAEYFEQNRVELLESADSAQRNYLLTYTRHERARLAWSLGDFEECRATFVDLLRHYQSPDFTCLLYGKELGSKFWQAHAYALLGQNAWALGNYDEASSLVRTAMRLREESGEHRFRAHNLRLLASILRATGDYDGGLELARESMRLGLAFGDKMGVAGAQLALGRLEVERGDHILALEHLSQCLAAARQSGNHVQWIDSLCALGRLELRIGHVAVARAYYDEANATMASPEIGHSNLRATAWLGLARVSLAEGNPSLAQAYLQQALGAKGTPAEVLAEIVEAMTEVQETDSGHTAVNEHGPVLGPKTK